MLQHAVLKSCEIMVNFCNNFRGAVTSTNHEYQSNPETLLFSIYYEDSFFSVIYKIKNSLETTVVI